jgi:poly(A) polymerase
MLQRGILKPVLPEIEPERLCDLEALIATEREAAIEPVGLRRLSGLLPREPLIAEKVAARLKLSNRSRKRLACAASPELYSSPRSLAYRVGVECAVDRLLLGGQSHEARAISGWKPPRMPVSGGSLIARGLVEGPIVARTLRQIEDRWVDGGFPDGDALEKIVSESLAAAKAS